MAREELFSVNLARQLEKLPTQGIGDPSFFLLKINNGFYMKAKCIKYKLFLQKKTNSLLRYSHFCKKFLIQTYGWQFFHGQFSQKFKKSLKVYLLLGFFS